jgi:NADP-reducing hydrogenase subunit HndB
MTKLRVEDLTKIKDSLKGYLSLKDGTYRVKVTVHMGTCGIAAGAQKIFAVMSFCILRVARDFAIMNR